MRVLLLISLILSFSTFAAESIGTVKLLKGEATTEDGTILKLNDSVFKGQVILTKDASFIRIKLNNDIALQAGPNSRLSINNDDKDGVAVLSLLRGSVHSRILPKAGTEKDRFRLKTPNAVMGVRGTTFFTTADSDKSSHLCVCEGKVAVSFNGENKIIQTKHHDQPLRLDTKWAAVAPKDFPGHTDKDADELEALLKTP